MIHRTELISELLNEGKIKLKPGTVLNATFHDSCYLGRYNDIYEQPREALQAAGLRLQEMGPSRSTGRCCGAGGRGMSMEEHGTKVNDMRLGDALDLAVQPKIIASACPFCLDHDERRRQQQRQTKRNPNPRRRRNRRRRPGPTRRNSRRRGGTLTWLGMGEKWRRQRLFFFFSEPTRRKVVF